MIWEGWKVFFKKGGVGGDGVFERKGVGRV